VKTLQTEAYAAVNMPKVQQLQSTFAFPGSFVRDGIFYLLESKSGGFTNDTFGFVGENTLFEMLIHVKTN